VKIFSIICLGLALVFVPAGRGFAEAPKPAPAKVAPVPVVPPRSAFTEPSSPREGRDPFFPESSRVFDAHVAQHASSEAVTTLAIKGYSVVNGRPIVIIANHSFMAGDEGDVISGGNRAHVRCLEIRPGTVVVEVNGARHEIHF